MARTDTLKLGTFVYTFGFNPAAWRHPDADVQGANKIDHLLNVAKISEAAKFDFMFLADSPPPPLAMPMRWPAHPPK